MAGYDSKSPNQSNVEEGPGGFPQGSAQVCRRLEQAFSCAWTIASCVADGLISCPHFVSSSRVKLLLEKQKDRYDTASRVMEEEVQVKARDFIGQSTPSYTIVTREVLLHVSRLVSTL